MSFPPVFPHDPIAAIADNVWVARGSVKMNPLVRITRNMAIVRDGDVLTLVNPIRLRDDELKKLDALGTVKNIMRIGCFHGMDDPFYMDRYDATFWCQEGKGTYSEPPIDHALTADGPLPMSSAQLFCFEGVNQPEGALLIKTGKGLLLTSDSIQHYGDYSNCNLMARIMMPRIGFPKTTLVGPIWLKVQTPEGGNLKAEFERLLELEFDALFSSHGTLLDTGAHAAVRRAVDKAFPA